MSGDNVRPISKTVAVGGEFVEEMARQGFHIGWGYPPVCRLCGLAWAECQARLTELEEELPPCEKD